MALAHDLLPASLRLSATWGSCQGSPSHKYSDLSEQGAGRSHRRPTLPRPQYVSLLGCLLTCSSGSTTSPPPPGTHGAAGRRTAGRHTGTRIEYQSPPAFAVLRGRPGRRQRTAHPKPQQHGRPGPGPHDPGPTRAGHPGRDAWAAGPGPAAPCGTGGEGGRAEQVGKEGDNKVCWSGRPLATWLPVTT